MNSNSLKALLIALIGLFTAVFITTQVLTSGGNAVGSFALYGMAGCFLFGLIVPKGGVYLMLFLAAYSDLIKRVMILETGITMLDITYVLGMAPMALAGVVVAVFVRKILLLQFTKRDFITLGVSTIFLAVGAAMGFSDGEGGLRALRIVADYGAFSYLIFVIPALFPTRFELVKLIKTSIFIFVPVAVYGIWQRSFGLADFEMTYLATGLSNESRQLAESQIRPFSTLNAASSLTMVAAALTFLCFVCAKARQLNSVVAILLGLLFAACCFMTFTRVGWVVLLLSFILVPVLRSRISTAAMYIAGILGFLMLVWQSDRILSNLHYWQDIIYGQSISDSEGQGLRIVTLSDRLIGFENMKRAENWKPFGIKGQGDYIEGLGEQYSTTFSHDAITGFLFRFGYIPFGIAVISGLFALYRLHKSVFRLPEEHRIYAQLGMAGAFAALASLMTGGTVFQFPANIFFWLLFCLTLVSIWEKNKLVSTTPASESLDHRRQNPQGRISQTS